MTALENQPIELIILQILGLDIPSISNLSLTNKDLYEHIYNNETFWRYKFIRDYYTPSNYQGLWKTLYKEIIRTYAIGCNSDGQLGTCNLKNMELPMEISKDAYKSISCGESHTLMIDKHNNVWGFGRNFDGQLGLGDTESRLIPTLIPNLKAKFVACGSFHSMVIDMDNNVWSFGFDECGQLGIDDQSIMCPDKSHRSLIPIQIPNIKAKYIACGDSHSIIIDMNNNVFGVGDNTLGQLGLGVDNTYIYVTPTLITDFKAKSAACGDNHTLFIGMDNNIWSTGSNSCGQLGLNDRTDRFVPTLIPGIKGKVIACGSSYSMIIDIDNNILGAGINYLHEDMEEVNRNIPSQVLNIKAEYVSCNGSRTAIIGNDGNVWQFGYLKIVDGVIRPEEIVRNPTKIPNFKGKMVTCGHDHTIMIGNIIV